MVLGSRVVRGPDWQWGDEDGGEGCVGTITSTKYDDKKDQAVLKVRWDHGQEQKFYIVGAGECYELRIFDSSTSGEF